MSKHQATTEIDPEIAAMTLVLDALKRLEASSQQRVLDYVAGRLDLRRGEDRQGAIQAYGSETAEAAHSHSTETGEATSDLEGISPVAIRWMRRNSLTAEGLSTIFSLGVEDIDLVAKTVPGRNKKERMHSVILLKGIASYLGGGVARVSHDQIKEACLHYDAFDSANFATYMKSFGPEVAGSKESGYALTARGITTATETLRSLLEAK